MLVLLSLITFVLVILTAYSKRIQNVIKRQLRVIDLVNKIPGPSLLEMFMELLKFKFDRER